MPALPNGAPLTRPTGASTRGGIVASGITGWLAVWIAIRSANAPHAAAPRPVDAPITTATIVDTAERLALLEPALADLRDASVAAELLTTEGAELAVSAQLAPVE